MLSKYAHIVNIGIQSSLVYRVNFFMRAAIGLIPLTATIFLWKAIYAGVGDGDEIAGYSLSAMVSYYLAVLIVDALTAVNEDDWQIVGDIKDGKISQFLLKPLDYAGYRFCLFLSGRVIYMVSALLPVAAFLLLHHGNLVFPADPAAWVAVLLALTMTAMLQFLMSYTMALLAFWLTEVSTFIFVLYAFEYVAGGHLFPVDILPPALAAFLSYTPFPYQLYFPVAVYLGRLEGAALAQGFCVQAFWVAAFFLGSRLLWRRGLRRYTAVGG